MMTDWRGPLRAIAACGEWRITTSDERPIYIMESREQLVGTRRPFTSAAAYAWQGDTLALRLDWLDGGDNRRAPTLQLHLQLPQRRWWPVREPEDGLSRRASGRGMPIDRHRPPCRAPWAWMHTSTCMCMYGWAH